MARNSVASARRTQLVSTYGVGSIFPAIDESFMICGIDDWVERLATEIPEPRLARSLGVQTFRAPPSGSRSGRDVPVIRFPETHFCPECRRLQPLSRFCSWDEHRCKTCERDLTPSRFVACCPNGHIQEFPYFSWVHSGQVGEEANHQLKLTTRGKTSSLADIEISCSCGVKPVSMAGSFRSGALRGIARCKGEQPWLPRAKAQGCDETLRTLQRGSSNVWFPMVRSALSIPPWSEGAHRVIAKHWAVLGVMEAEHLATTIERMGLAASGLTVASLVQAILERRGEGGSAAVQSEVELRLDEYYALVQGKDEKEPHQQFVCTAVEVEPDTREYFKQISEVARLREVRALEGFTRVTPAMPGMDPGRKAALSAGTVSWLPAIEVLGEGIFLRLDDERLRRWENTDFARSRVEVVLHGLEMRAKRFKLSEVATLAPRDLLLHSIAHILLNELSLDAGYPTASLRERLYSAKGQAGVLIYTASADSAGSLGGLASQSEPERIAAVIRSGVLRAGWCSADPVCIESASTGNDGLNMSACHACLLLPETSCERQNEGLDRATLVGTPSQPHSGFFADLLAQGF